MKSYISRTIEPILKKAVKQFPAVVLTGPRQAGKTTILRHFFSDTHRYISLEPPDIRSSALADPRGFLELNEPPLILDEIQYVPELLFYIKEKIDQNRDRYGQYVLTGSQNLLLLQQVTETLAGRAAMLRLLPLSFPEIRGMPDQSFPWEGERRTLSSFSVRDFWPLVLRGSYPELHENPEKDPALWQGSYLQTYLERDIRSFRQVGDLTQFQLFLKSVAIRSGQLFNATEVAKEIGVAVNTIKAWLGVLEASYQIAILRPYFENRGKRLVKTPKIYFLDVGTLCYLSGLQEVETLYRGPMAGHIVETFLFSEIYKRLSNRGGHRELYFWRTTSGQEVDLLVEEKGKLIPIEVKATSTPKPQMAKGILSFLKDFSDRVEKGYVIHLGEQRLPLAPKVEGLPFAQL